MGVAIFNVYLVLLFLLQGAFRDRALQPVSNT